MPLSQKKILILGSYPIVRPQHGGQKRTHAVVTEYKKHFDHVKFVAVYSRWANPVAAPTDIPVSHSTDELIMDARQLGDTICGDAIISEPAVKQRLTRLLQTYRPDIIQIEQVYGYLGLKLLLDELGLDPILVFDTHNLESAMKEEIYQTDGMSAADIKPLLDRLAAAERELAARAAITVAVGPNDLEAYQKLGARHVLLAPNGIYPQTAKPRIVAAWRQELAAAGVAHSLLYVSSAHLPNWAGFQEMVSDGLGFLAPDTRILIAGGLSDYLESVYKWPRTPGAATFWLRAQACGSLSEERLAGLLAAADVIILPITVGGGSNLKTAEALLAGKPVVATSYAFRAFEQFKDFPGVTIADTPAQFRQTMLSSLSAPAPHRTAAQIAELQAVTWPHCLAGLIKEVAAL